MLLLNRAKANTATVGTGTVALGTAFASNFLTWAAAGAVDGKRYSYLIEQGGDAEVGWGLYTAAGATLTRNLTISTTGALLNLAGAATVACIARQEDYPQLIEEQVLTVAAPTVTFASIPQTFRNLELEIIARCAGATGGNNRHIYVKPNNDGGANYTFVGQGYGAGSPTPITFTSVGPTAGGSIGVDVGWAPNANAPANEFGTVSSKIFGYTSTLFNKKFEGRAVLRDLTTAAGQYTAHNHGTWHPATPAAITSLVISNDLGVDYNIGCVFRLRGIP